MLLLAAAVAIGSQACRPCHSAIVAAAQSPGTPAYERASALFQERSLPASQAAVDDALSLDSGLDGGQSGTSVKKIYC